MVNFENYEEYMLLYADNELTKAEKEDFEQFMAAHPELESELTLYETMRLVPDTTQVFEHKETLLKKPAVIPFKKFTLFAAAAATAALLVTIGLKDSGNNIVISKAKPAQPRVVNSQPIVAATNNVQPDATTALSKVIAKAHKPAIKEHQVVLPARNATSNNGAIHNPTTIENNVPDIAYQQPKTDTTQTHIIEEKEEVYIAQVETEKDVPSTKKTRLLASLFADKTGGIDEIGRAMSAKLDKAKELKDRIKDTDVSVKIGDKQLFVVKF